MNFEEKLIERLKRLEKEVERLRVWERPAGGSGVTDHGALTGLADNDHPQYLLTTGKAADSDKLDGIDSTGFATAGHDHDSDYLGITAKASDSDKLDNIDSTGFVQTSGNQSVGGIKTFTSIPALPATNPTTANQAVRKGFADATYLGISAKAADSDKLDGLDSTAFVQTSALGVWNNWTPTQTGWTALPTGTYRYCQIGKMCFFTIDITAGTSNSNLAELSLPVPAKSGTYWSGVNGMAMNNGTVLSVASKWYIDASNSLITFGTDMGTGLWTASGTKRVRTEGFYEIA